MSDSKFEAMLWAVVLIGIMTLFGFGIAQSRGCQIESNEHHRLLVESCRVTCSGNVEAAVPQSNGTIVCVCEDLP